jgi:hypothetical protein
MKVIAYHGTPSGDLIRKNGFDLDKGRFSNQSGVHFMTDPKYAKHYGDIIKVELELKNPMDFSMNFEIRDTITQKLLGKDVKDLSTADWRKHTATIDTEFRKEAIKRGYDSIYDKSQPEVVVLHTDAITILESEGGEATLDNTPGQGEVKFPTETEFGSGDRFDNVTVKKKKKRKNFIYSPLTSFIKTMND